MKMWTLNRLCLMTNRKTGVSLKSGARCQSPQLPMKVEKSTLKIIRVATVGMSCVCTFGKFISEILKQGTLLSSSTKPTSLHVHCFQHGLPSSALIQVASTDKIGENRGCLTMLKPTCKFTHKITSLLITAPILVQ